MNQEGVIISYLSDSPGGIFAATAHLEARFSCYLHIFFFLFFLSKKKKKTGPKRKERVPFCQEKRKSSVKATRTS